MVTPGQTFRFERIRRDAGGSARVGRLETAHGAVDTPAFMPVGTQGALKALLPSQAETLGVEMILANTYHLYLRPGPGLIGKAGGLHEFMGWRRPILPDSGGFQVFSLSPTLEVGEEGVRFRSVYDGRQHLLTPAKAVAVQADLGYDVAMILEPGVASPPSP